MRLNWFLPFRPAGRRGPLRRALAALGPTWLASPWRRLIQVAALGLFLWLLFYVAWPYTVQPARRWPGWSPANVDVAYGHAQLTADQPPQPPLPPGKIVYVLSGEGPEAMLGCFRIARADGAELDLEPAAPLQPAQIDRLAESFGPWTLHEADPAAWPSHYADDFLAKERLPAESFLAIDPLVSISTAIASRSWVWSLGSAGVLLALCLLVPRGFCALLCPLGTLLDAFDWLVSQRTTRWRPGRRGWWAGLKYALLAAVMAAALGSVLLAGFVAAIPLVTRGLVYLLLPLQTGLERGWHQVPPIGPGHFVSLGLLAVVVGLGLLGPRFWCKYVCPSGGVFSLANRLRLFERKVRSSCIACGKCVEICPFDAIRPDFSTRTADCTFCQACGGACPVAAIQFVGRWNAADGPPSPCETEPPAKSNSPLLPGEGQAGKIDSPLPRAGEGQGVRASRRDRRQLLATAVAVAAGAVGGAGSAAAIALSCGRGGQHAALLPVRPPGSLPEPQFLQTCIRCGECLQACPNAVLQPLGLQQGLVGLWTPYVVADWSGCEPSCNLCGRVCPTGAIRALPLEEKRVVHMGLAVVNPKTCLPLACREACQLCVDECAKAGYLAIEFVRVGTQADEHGQPLEDSGFLAPVVLPERCVGCGICQTRCFAINARKKQLLSESAIVIEAGEGKEDRIAAGSYRALRAAEERARQERIRRAGPPDGGYLPDELK